MKIAIIGAGMAGIACARALRDDGLSAVVIDKGRGVGGRISTRRTDHGAQFDHGAQYITARDPGFQACLAEAEAAGAVGRWNAGRRDGPAYVGLPGMTGLAKHLARGLDIRTGQRIDRVSPHGSGWEIAAGAWSDRFDNLVITAPAPQTVALLGADHALSRRISEVVMDPCLTLMLTLKPGVETEVATRRDPDAAIAWIAAERGKPGRPDAPAFVAQAGPDWSRAHLESDPADIAARMLPIVCDALGVGAEDVRHAAAHRWRYARVARPLGAPFASDPGGTLFAGGDWCIAPRVEAAWQSGGAIAAAIGGQARA